MLSPRPAMTPQTFVWTKISGSGPFLRSMSPDTGPRDVANQRVAFRSKTRNQVLPAKREQRVRGQLGDGTLQSPHLVSIDLRLQTRTDRRSCPHLSTPSPNREGRVLSPSARCEAWDPRCESQFRRSP